MRKKSKCIDSNYKFFVFSFIQNRKSSDNIILKLPLKMFCLDRFRFAKYREVRESVHNFEGCVAACITIAYEELLKEVGGKIHQVVFFNYYYCYSNDMSN